MDAEGGGERDGAAGAAFAEDHSDIGHAQAKAEIGRAGDRLGDPEIDLVVIATPDPLHAPQAHAALDAGKAVVIDKPFAVTLDEARAVADVLATGWVTQGPKVAQFEKLFAERIGVRHAVATTSCTTALHLALVVAGIGHGDEVICPSYSFIATANAVWQNGATPVFADVDPLTDNIDATTVEAVLTERTKAIMPVHLYGQPADAPVYELRTAEDGTSLLQFGDGTTGAPLPTGRGNVTATYRTGVGLAGRVAAGALTTSRTSG